MHVVAELWVWRVMGAFPPIHAGSRSVRSMWVLLDPVFITVFNTFLCTYLKQLTRPNPIIRWSIMHGPCTAWWRYSHILCRHGGLNLDCNAHNTDHDNFLHRTDFLGIHLYFPEPPNGPITGVLHTRPCPQSRQASASVCMAKVLSSSMVYSCAPQSVST